FCRPAFPRLFNRERRLRLSSWPNCRLLSWLSADTCPRPACGERAQSCCHDVNGVRGAPRARFGAGGKTMSSSLLMTRRFAPLFWTQFFSAFSAHFLENALVFLILFASGGADAEALITLAAAVFIAPYFFLSALGGELADRYDKAVVARRLKFSEIGIAFIAVVGFGLHSVPLLFVAL